MMNRKDWKEKGRLFKRSGCRYQDNVLYGMQLQSMVVAGNGKNKFG